MVTFTTHDADITFAP